MIFYFSATGNSEYLARKLAEATGYEMYDIAAELRGKCGYNLKENEEVYLVSPVYFYGMPLNVKEFIDRVTFNRKPVFNVMINFGTFPGDAIRGFIKEIESKGFETGGRYEIRMPENYVLLFEPPTEDDAQKILDEADVKMEKICNEIKNGKKEDILSRHSIFKSVFGHIGRPLHIYGRKTKGFHVNGSCTGCGKCVNLCPPGIIEMSEGVPVWTEKRCLRCCSCINRCPSKAIEFGHLTKGRRRYHNPRL